MANVVMEVNDKKFGKVTIIAHPVSGVSITEDDLVELVLANTGIITAERTIADILHDMPGDSSKYLEGSFAVTEVEVSSVIEPLEDFLCREEESATEANVKCDVKCKEVLDWPKEVFGWPEESSMGEAAKDLSNAISSYEADLKKKQGPETVLTLDKIRKYFESSTVRTENGKPPLEPVAQQQFDKWKEEQPDFDHWEGPSMASYGGWNFEDTETLDVWNVVYRGNAIGEHYSVRYDTREIYINHVLGEVGRARALLSAQIELSCYDPDAEMSLLDNGQVDDIADRLFHMTNVYSRLTR